MSASQYDFNIDQGSSFRLSITYTDNDGNPINLTDFCGRIVWLTDDNNTFIFSTENIDPSLYSFNIDPLIGKLELQIPASVTNSYAFTSAKYDLEIESPVEIYPSGGKQVTRILFGNVYINRRYSENETLLEC